ncbi:tetratricopeptide repeat family protein, putative [Hepatocystis sp. ex Piliocolobus tephrosceles]|nr:tetratricopeptide repeat family protein, putative [Hepatocystis sp. ex Piliocolobus tephrosceles]
MLKLKHLTKISRKKYALIFAHNFSGEKKVNYYNGPSDTYINVGFKLKNDETEKLISLCKDNLKLKLMTSAYCSEEIGKHYLELAILEHKNLLLTDAKNHYFKCYEIFKKIKGDVSIICANIETYIGVVYKDLGEFEKAKEFLHLSLINKKLIIKDKNYLLVDTINNLASLYQIQKKYDISIEYFLECINILISSPINLNKNEQIALCYYNLSFSYIGINNFTSAITYLIKSYDIAKTVFGPDHNLTVRIKKLHERLKEENK